MIGLRADALGRVARKGHAVPAALSSLLAAECERWALWLPVGIAFGVALYFGLSVEPPTAAAPAAIGVAVAAAVASRGRTLPLLAAVAVGVVALGLAAAQLRTSLVAAPVIAERTGPVTVEGRVRSVEIRPGDRRVVLDRLVIARLAPEKTPERVRLRLAAREGETLPAAGDRIRLRAVLTPPPEPAAPGAFDFARQAFFQRIGGVGFAFGTIVPVHQDEADALALGIERLRAAIGARIREGLPGGVGGMAAALIIGDRGGMTDGDIDAMRDSGLAHLLAISGLHVGLVSGILFFVFRLGLALHEPIALNHPIKKWAALGALAGAGFYLAISGATVPTQRAFVMLAIMCLAVLVDRSAISMRTVAWAAAAILLLTPESLTGASFQMSFAAVIALIAAYEGARGMFHRVRAGAGQIRRAWLYLGGVLFSSVIATLATAPFAAFHFNRVALYGVIANMVAVPITGFWIMPLAIAALVLMPLGLEGPPLDAMGWGVDAVLATARAIADLPGAATLVPSMPGWGLAVVALGGLWLCLWRGRWRWIGLAAVAGGLASAALTSPPDIVVDGGGRLVAVRSDDGGYALSSSRFARFEADNWLRRAGTDKRHPWPRTGQDGGLLRCDALGCMLQRSGATVALVTRPEALGEDCQIADVVVSVVPAPRSCRRAAKVVDRFDLWRGGAHALWLHGGGATVRSVAEVRGERPWVLTRGGGKGAQ